MKTGRKPRRRSRLSRWMKPCSISRHRCLCAAALLVLIAAGAVWAANRGGGNDGNSAANAATYEQVTTDNHYSVARFTVRAGQPLTVTLRNDGQHQHNLHILNVTDRSGN